MKNIPEYEGWKPEDYIALMHPESFARRFLKRELYPFQKSIVENMMVKDRVVVLCARQMGKTEVVAIYATWYLFAHPDRHILIFAPKYEQAVDNLFARVLDFIKSNPKLLQLVFREPTTGKLKLGVDNIKLTTGGTARAMSASPDANIEGWSGHLILVDESQNLSNVVFYKKILPMATATGGKIIQIGTPRSRNHFYESYKDKKTWTVLEFNWKHGPEKYREEVKKNKKIMPYDDFKTEYELKWIDSDSLYFNSAELDAAFTGNYELPLITEAEKYVGIDLAKTMDKTVVTIVANEGGVYRIVNLFELRGGYGEQRKQILQILDRYNPRKVLIDATGLGSTFLDFLQEESRMPHKIEGYVMSNKAKTSELYPNLKLLFSQGAIELPAHTDLETELRELRKTVTTFGNIQIHAPPRGHDDYPDSLALACLAAAPFERRVSEPKIIQIVDQGNLNYMKVFEPDKNTKEGIKIWVVGDEKRDNEA